MRLALLTTLFALGVVLLSAGLDDQAAGQVPSVTGVTKAVEQAAPAVAQKPVTQVVQQAPAPVRETVKQAPAAVQDTVDQVVQQAPAPVQQAPAPVQETVRQAPAPVRETVDEVVRQAPAPVRETVDEVVRQAPAPVRDTANDVVRRTPAPVGDVVRRVAPTVGGGATGGRGDSPAGGAPSSGSGGSGGETAVGGDPVTRYGGGVGSAGEVASGRAQRGRQVGGTVTRAEAARERDDRLRDVVRRLSGCLDVLPDRQERVLRLRAALDQPRTRSRAAVARRARIRTATVERLERRGLDRLRVAARTGRCGDLDFDVDLAFNAAIGSGTGGGDDIADDGVVMAAAASDLLGEGAGKLLGVAGDDADGAVAGERTSSPTDEAEAEGGGGGGLPSPLSLLPVDDPSDLPLLLLAAALAMLGLFYAARRDVGRQ